MRRIVLTLSLAATAALGIVQPAAAIEKTFGVSKTFTSADGARSLTQAATARILSGDASTVTISIDCSVFTDRRHKGHGNSDLF